MLPPISPSSSFATGPTVFQPESSLRAQAITAEQFYEALFREDASLLRTWIDEGAVTDALLSSPNPRTDESVLVYLAKNPKRGITAEVEEIFRMAPADVIDKPDHHGNTPLLLLAKLNPSAELARILLERGANADARDDKGRTALINCLRNTAWGDDVRFLCRHGAELNVPDEDGRTALHHAVLRTNCTLIPHILTAGADRSAKDRQGHTPLDLAIQACQERNLTPDEIETDTVVQLLKAGREDLVEMVEQEQGQGIMSDLLRAARTPWYAFKGTLDYAVSLFSSWTVTVEQIEDTAAQRAPAGSPRTDLSGSPEGSSGSVASTSAEKDEASESTSSDNAPHAGSPSTDPATSAGDEELRGWINEVR